MDDHSSVPEGQTPPAWQPFTFSGAAAFAAASLTRIMAVAFTLAVLIGVGSVASFYWTWGPALDEAVGHLPPAGEIREGRLIWPAAGATRLVDNQFLAIVVRVGAAPKPGQSADVQIELGESGATASSLLGHVTVDYPSRLVFVLSRTEAEPLWGAWRPYVHLGIGVMVVCWLMVLWSLLAVGLVPPLRVYAYLADRVATCSACWRVAVACLLPGATLMGVAILLYGLSRITLVDLLLVNALHLVVGLVYLLIVPLRLPRRGSPFSPPPEPASPSSVLPEAEIPPTTPAPRPAAADNPFTGVPNADDRKRKNPFAGG